jgi:hypothetical protein
MIASRSETNSGKSHPLAVSTQARSDHLQEPSFAIDVAFNMRTIVRCANIAAL